MSRDKHNESFFRFFSLKSKRVKLHYMAAVLGLGVLMMAAGSFFKGDESYEPASVINMDESEEEGEAEVFRQTDDSGEEDSKNIFRSYYEKQLKEVLEEIAGVSNVKVLIRTESTEKKVFQTDKSEKEQLTDETDSEGGTRKVTDKSTDEQVVIIRSGDEEKPLIAATELPEITGVLIVANGVDNIQVKTWVIEAVSRGLDVPSHRIAVMPRKQKEDLS